MSMSLARASALVAALMVALASFVAPVTASEADDDDDEASTEVGPLEVEARPAIVAADALLVVEAEFEIEGDEDEGESEDEQEGESEGEGEPGQDEDPADGSGGASAATLVPTSVEFSVDFGDGTPAETMTVTDEEADGEEYEAEAIASHRYGAEGEYVVTVTATPSTGEPTVATVDVAVGSGGARMSGDDRVDTSTRLSREAFPTDGSADAVLLARSDAFADALAAGTMTLLEEAPVLLTGTAQVAPAVLDEIVRALGDTGIVYLLGGESAISSTVADALTALGYDVVRIAGEDRIDTAVAIARFLVDAGVDIDEVVLASAGNFPDALAGGSFAAEVQAPILLSAPDVLDPRVEALLRDLGADVDVLVLGGEAAISQEVVDQILALGNDVERLAGEDRFETSAAVADALFDDATAVVVATGAAFPDALSASALAARLHAPVLLVGSDVPESVRQYLETRAGQIDVVYVLGGRNAVSGAVRAEVQQLLGLNG